MGTVIDISFFFSLILSMSSKLLIVKLIRSPVIVVWQFLAISFNLEVEVDALIIFILPSGYHFPFRLYAFFLFLSFIFALGL